MQDTEQKLREALQEVVTYARETDNDWMCLIDADAALRLPTQVEPVEGWEVVALPKRETEAMHDAVMPLLYAGVSRTRTDDLWQAYRGALLATRNAPPASQEQAAMPANWFPGMPESYRTEAWRIKQSASSEHEMAGMLERGGKVWAGVGPQSPSAREASGVQPAPASAELQGEWTPLTDAQIDAGVREAERADGDCDPIDFRRGVKFAEASHARAALSAQAVPQDERDKVDAERYRWLRDESYSPIWDFGGCYPRTGLDAAIDAAIAARKGGAA